MEDNLLTLGRALGAILWVMSMLAFKSCTNQTPQKSVYPSAYERQRSDEFYNRGHNVNPQPSFKNWQLNS